MNNISAYVCRLASYNGLKKIPRGRADPLNCGAVSEKNDKKSVNYFISKGVYSQNFFQDYFYDIFVSFDLKKIINT